MGNSVRDVTIISVCYNSADVVEGMLQTVPHGVPVILVDNASGDINRVRSLAAQANARLIELGENVGYGKACNVGAERADTEFLLFLNPDCVLASDVIDHLLVAAHAHPNAVAMNPALLEDDGCRYFKRRSVLLPQSAWLPRGWPQSDCAVPVLSGAALLVRKVHFDAVGGFDPAIFLYHEDDDLSLRLAARGDLMFIRNAVVLHSRGRSSPRTPDIAALKAWHMGRSRVYAARKHRASFPFLRTLTEALVQLASPAAVVSERKRAKQAAFLKGVISMRSPNPDGPS